MPRAGNPQALSRFTYTLNNPINLADPSGHIPAVWNAPCIDGLFCGRNYGASISRANLNPKAIENTKSASQAEKRQGTTSPIKKASSERENSVGAPFTCTTIVINQCNFLMYPDGDTSPNGTPNKELARALGNLGAVADLIEFALAFSVFASPPSHGAAAAMAVIDGIITTGSCIAAGECYFGSPGGNLPNVLVVNQDVVVTAAEIGAGLIPGVDILTSLASVPYDSLRAEGVLPNYISVGYSPAGPYGIPQSLLGTFYFFLYP